MTNKSYSAEISKLQLKLKELEDKREYFLEWKRKHDLWIRINDSIELEIKTYKEIIDKKIEELKKPRIKYEGVFWKRPREIEKTKEEKEQLEFLEIRLKNFQIEAQNKVYSLHGFPVKPEPLPIGLHIEDSEYSTKKTALLKSIETLKKEYIKEINAANDGALLARAKEESRVLGDKVKSQLQKNHPCPYCSRSLGVQPHADHIHPISKGGLSTTRNMVYTCAKCNMLKGNLTLASFIKKYSLNRAEIEEMLTKLGKEF